MTAKLRSKQANEETKNKVIFELEPFESERIITAKRVRHSGGVEYF